MRALRLLPVLFCVLVLAGCRVQSNVDVEVLPDGSGSVTVEVRLDAEAAAAVPDLGHQLKTDDLVAAGWTVDGPVGKDGETIVTAKHPFGGPEEANAVLVQLGGKNGPFKDFTIDHHRSLAGVRTTFSGSVDLTKGIESFGDETLRARTGLPLGVDAAELQQSLGVDWAASFPVDVTVDLPGDDRRSPTVPEKTWHATYGTVTKLSDEASARNVATLLFLVLTVLSTAGAVLVAMLWKSGKYRPRHRKKIAGGGVRARDLLADAASEAERP